MTNSYNLGQLYSQNKFQNNNNYFKQQPSIFSSVINSAAVGFGGGAVVGAGVSLIKNRYPFKDGDVTDSFAKQVMDKIISKDYTVRGKNFFKQKYNLLKKLDRVNSPEKFIKLINENKEYTSGLYESVSLNSICNTVTKDNLKGKISALKKRIEISLEHEIRNIKDMINLCWDKENKKFVKHKNVDENIFKVIKNTKNNIQWKKMLKYGGITAGVFGAITLVYSMLIEKGNSNNYIVQN